ncbi:NERD domain-containing protein [Ferrimonas marina]|uniref:Uncharacterized protein n=1 Tax=Ferrimonas marina TaxID=299255 RepID=A0A1M5TCW2_9GAMM|nr:NERD domain-containing protein [Ferrimonas marina]SHH48526.1 hypothetical protein SAMN02745129_2087 [Ferrimonas marina]
MIVLSAFLVIAILLAVWGLFTLSYNNERRCAERARARVSGALSAIIDEEHALCLHELRFVHQGKERLIDHMIFTSTRVFALASTDLDGILDAPETGKWSLGFRFTTLPRRNRLAELNESIDALLDHLEFEDRSYRAIIVPLVCATGHGSLTINSSDQVQYFESIFEVIANEFEQASIGSHDLVQNLAGSVYGKLQHHCPSENSNFSSQIFHSTRARAEQAVKRNEELGLALGQRKNALQLAWDFLKAHF